MRLLGRLSFRIQRLLGIFPVGRCDVVGKASLRRWILGQDGCVIECDLQVRGHRNALDFLRLGSGCAVDKGCIVWIASESEAEPHISLGNRVYIGPYCFLGSFLPLSIGENTIVGAFTYVITANHRAFPGLPVRDQGYESAPITIGKDVWIGCHVVILPGVTIGDHAVIGAGAVVNKDVPPWEKWGGVPAKKIGMRVSG